MPDGAGTGRGTRVIALVGPYQSGKTTLLEEILHRCGTVPRPGKVTDGSSFGDASPEARAHLMTVEANIARCTFMGDDYVFLDAPGSVEFTAEARAALTVADIAVVVCEPDPKKIPALQRLCQIARNSALPFSSASTRARCSGSSARHAVVERNWPIEEAESSSQFTIRPRIRGSVNMRPIRL